MASTPLPEATAFLLARPADKAAQFELFYSLGQLARAAGGS
jgi:hypothetical protein